MVPIRPPTVKTAPVCVYVSCVLLACSNADCEVLDLVRQRTRSQGRHGDGRGTRRRRFVLVAVPGEPIWQIVTVLRSFWRRVVAN